MMTMQCVRFAVLGAVVMAPVVLLAQTGQPGMSTQPNQPGMGGQTNQPGQAPGTQPNGMPGSAQDSAGTAGMSGQMMQDKMFLRKAAEGGMAEVQFGQLAVNKGGSDEVKSFGQKMVTDHTALNDSMKPIADHMGAMLPKKLKKDDQAELDKLNGLSGNDFDTEYLTAMVKDHHKDLHDFRMEAASAADPELKAAVESGQRVILEHTQMVDKLAKDRGIPVPERGNRQPAGAMPNP